MSTSTNNTAESSNDETVRRTFGHTPGGGLISHYHIDMDAFGVLGLPMFRRLDEAKTKRERKTALTHFARVLATYKILAPHEEIESISLGSDSSGNAVIVVACRSGQGPGVE